MPYDHKKIEKKWQARWQEQDLYRARDFSWAPKYYCLIEFPYASGAGLHVGHIRSYVALDVLARLKRMEGFNVLYPIGWDAFGLPTENYAIKMKLKPQQITAENIKNFRRQIKSLGLSFDWSREINTTDPRYYKWTQWIFLKLYERGLAYKKDMPINWCPSCKIGLANEEVIEGKCERCGMKTTTRKLNQWLLKITAYADRLVQDLENVDYLEKIKTQQLNWIGRTQGIIIDYPVVASGKVISCYSTRPDTNFGATFVVIAPEHPLVGELTTKENEKAVQNYLEEAKKKSELERTQLQEEKTGVFAGSSCLNRLNGERLPIWVSDFVVATAGTGAVVGVPAHDERDWQFAKKYNLKIVPVIKPKEGQTWDYEKAAFTDINETLVFNSQFLDGLTALEAKEKIMDYLVQKGWGRRKVNYKLRDWIFSRQHYWGEPIPIIHCEKCGMVPVPEDDLPVELPEIEHYEPTETGQSPLAAIREWVHTTCPQCTGPAKRETDTMPNWAGSSWYFLRYIDPANDKALADPPKLAYWLPVDLYNGGMEHTTLHLLYSRFWHKFLFDIKVVPTPEPYKARRSHGMVLGEDGQKMSKSRGNVINPDEVIKKYGADTLRLYEMFMGPFTEAIPWSTRGLVGARRFLEKAYTLTQKPKASSEDEDLERLVHQTIQKVTEDVKNFRFNTVVSALMILVNKMSKREELAQSHCEELVKILSPLAPHLAEELWHELGHPQSIFYEKWPSFDPAKIKEERVELVVQVNGRLRDKVSVFSKMSKKEIQELVLQREKIKKWLPGPKIKKVVFVPGKLINIVT